MADFNNFDPLASPPDYSNLSGLGIFSQQPDNHGNEEPPCSYPVILQELQECLTRINRIISIETESSDIVVTLFKIRQKLMLALNLTESKIRDNSATSSCYGPENGVFCSPYKNNNNNSNNNNVDNVLPESSTCSDSFTYEVDKKRFKYNNVQDIQNSYGSTSGGTTPLADEKMLQIVKNTQHTPKVAGLREIVGLANIKKILKSLVVLPRTQPQLFQNRRTGNSVLLFGPPGTGKTRLVHALAAESNSVLHCISASDVLSHYVGQTEKTIKFLFQYLKESNKFSILFIDEIDGFCRKRSDSEQEHTRRIKTELMCQMTNYEDCKEIFIICATNCPWDLDSAILRRFQQRIYVPLPTRLERMEFFRYFTRNEDLVDYSCGTWAPLLDKTEGCSGSDLSDIVQNALNIPINELEDCKIWKQTTDNSNGLFFEPAITEEDFSQIICSELSDLPPNSVRARRAGIADFLDAAVNVKLTVTAQDLKKFEVFNGASS